MDKYISNKIRNISLFMTLFVVLIHSNNLDSAVSTLSINSLVQNFIGQGLGRVSVPIFFLISGYLFFYNFVPSKEKWKYKYQSRFKSLFIPYFIWCTGWLVILFIVELFPIGRAIFSDTIVAEYSLKELFVNTYIYPIPYQFWYIRSLMLDVVLAPVFYYIIKSLGKKSIPVFIVVWLSYSILELFLGDILILKVLDYPFTLFGVGAALAIYNVDLNFKFIENKHIVIIGVLYLIASILKTAAIYVAPDLLILAEAWSVLFGVPFYWLIYDKLTFVKDKKFAIAKYAIFVYFLHIPLQSVIKKLWFKVMPLGDVSSLIIFFLAPIITSVICILVAMFMNRFMNRIYRCLTGGR